MEECACPFKLCACIICFNLRSNLFPEINLSDNDCKVVYEKQGNCSVIDSPTKNENNSSEIKSANADQKSSNRKRKRPHYSSNKDPDYKCGRSWNKHRSGKRFPKKTHVTRFLERQYGWRTKDECEIICEKQGNCSAIECSAKKKDKISAKKPGNASSHKIKRSKDKSHSKLKKSRTHHRSGRKSYYELPRKTHLSQWRQWTLPVSGNSQVSVGILHSDHAPQQHLLQPSRALTLNYPRLMVTVALDAISDNTVIQVNKKRDFTESQSTKEGSSSEIKTDNANNSQPNTRRRKGRSNKDSNSKQKSHTSGRNNNALPSKKHTTQVRKLPHKSTEECDYIALPENRDVKEDINEYSNFNRYFNQKSSSNIEHVNRSQTVEHSPDSNPSYSKFGKNSLDLQTSRYGSFTQEPRFHRKNRKPLWKKPRLARNINEALTENIGNGPSCSVEKQTDLMSSEVPKKRDDASKPSTICGNRQKKMPDLTIYDFNENVTIYSPDQNYHVYLNSRKCFGNIDNLSECETNFISTMNQRGHSEVDARQNTGKAKSVYEATSRKTCVSLLNPSYPTSSNICNDYEKNYNRNKRNRNRRRKRTRKSARTKRTTSINELVNDAKSAGRSTSRRKIPSKKKDDVVERKIRKKKIYIKTGIKKEKAIVKNKKNIKKTIKKEKPQNSTSKKI